MTKKISNGVTLDLDQFREQLEKLEDQLQDPDFYNSPEKLKQVSQKYNQLKDLINKYSQLKEIEKSIAETEKLILQEKDKEIAEMAAKELKALEKQRHTLEKEIKHQTKPLSDIDKKNVIIEIRAGTGGEEAALFAADLFRMYSRFAEKKQWPCYIISSNPTDIGGFKEMIFEIKGQGAYSILKNESGVHRVQRIPETEKSGRIHTSAASVVVLPEAKPVDIKIDPKDLKIDVFRASSHGGQHVQKNETAVRITHLPTNTTVSCQDERSQAQNKERALSVLRSRLLASEERKKAKKLKKQRLSQIGTGDRSEKIRTYNFPQNRITDHRIQKSWHDLEQILHGNISPIIEALQSAEK